MRKTFTLLLIPILLPMCFPTGSIGIPSTTTAASKGPVTTQRAQDNSERAQPGIATEEQTKAFLASHGGDCFVFPEDRSRPIRRGDALPLQWLRQELAPYVEGVTGRNEYFTFQLGVFAARKALRNTHVVFDDLLEKNGTRIPASRLTCLTTESTDASGKKVRKALHTRAGNVLPLWIGVDIPADIRPGSYAGSVEIRSDSVKEEVLLVRLIVRDTLFIDRGDGEPWRHSWLRLRNPAQGVHDLH
jgi:hypothetical protein